VFDGRGRRRARYDKIHLFDVDVDDDRSYRESRSLQAGNELCVVDTPVGRLGLAVCFDLRFPELFRALAAAGAELFAVPSAFTAATGAAHWELLARSRAVENLCYVIGADQTGEHADGRRTFGDSMIVDPWGAVLARRVTGTGVVTAAVDTSQQHALRQRFPVLDQRRTLPGLTHCSSEAMDDE